MSDIQDEAYSEAMDEISKLQAEIERLKQYACQCEASVHSTQEGYADLQAQIITQKQLITELADALHGYGLKPWHQYRELIQRAREDTK